MPKAVNMNVRNKFRAQQKADAKRKGLISVRSARAVRKIAQAVVTGVAETKQVSFWSGNSGGVSAPGTWPPSAYAWSVQNQLIQNNATDIHRLIPRVFQGTGETQRTGSSIKTTSLSVRGVVGLNPTLNIQGGVPTAGYPIDITAVVYVLSHVSLKNYKDLSNNNNFFQMLHTGDQGSLDAAGVNVTTQTPTTAFGGQIHSSEMAVSSHYYKLLKKKKFRLVNDGALPPSNQTTTPQNVLVQSTPLLRAKPFSFNLTKHLPANLKYPEINPGLASQPNNIYDPTNTAIFMCVGYYMNDGTVLSQPQSLIGIQYVADLKFKDM